MSIPSQFSTDGLAELRALGAIIQDSIARIDSAVTAEHLEFPSSTTPFTPESELARSLPAVAEATSYLVAAAFQTIQLVRAPPLTILTIVEQHTLSACLGIAARANAAEVCREKGPQGADVRDIAAVTGIDSSKLARVLRLLATYHIFLEVTPDVFANNRISSLLDTGKPVRELIENPAEKFIGAAGLAAGIGHCTDEFMKAAAYFEDALFHPEVGKSDEPGASGLTLAFPNEPFSSIFEWLELKGNEKRFHRFGAAMESSQRTAPPGYTLSGFDWAGLPKNSLIVDVGGGIGAQSMTVAKACPHLRFIIQDRAPVMEDFKTFWQVEAPEVLSSGRVAFSVHNFFDPQPVGDAAVFLMRMILHDWPEKYCIKILRNLRAAANPSTRLVIIDNVVPYACAEDDPIPVPGVNRPVPPAPLLANLGYANAAPYLSDVMMMSMFNAKERSLSQFRDLFEQCGWNLVETHQVGPHNFNVQKMIGVPAAPAVPAAA